MWYNNDLELCRAKLTIEKFPRSFLLSEDVRKEMVQELLYKLITSNVFEGKDKFDRELTRYAITAWRNLEVDVLKQEGLIRNSTACEQAKTLKKTMKVSIISTCFYSEKNCEKDVPDSQIGEDSGFEKAHLEHCYKILKSAVSKELNNVECGRKRQFLHETVWHNNRDMTVAEHAMSVGFKHGNPAMVKKRFIEKLNLVITQDYSELSINYSKGGMQHLFSHNLEVAIND